MALTRQQKQETVSFAKDALSEAQSVVFMAYDALNVIDSEELRGKLFEQGISLRVLPKRLLKIALSDQEVSFDPTEYEGQMALAWGGDVVAPAKVLYDFAKGKDYIRLVGGMMEGSVISSDEVIQLASLPSREELLAKLVGTINGPVQGMHTVLSGVPRSFVYALQAISDSKEE